MRILAAAALAALAAGTFAEEDWSRIYLGSCPSVNADGSMFVFEWNDSLWSAPTAGGRASRLTPEESQEGWPAISRDGARLAFLSTRDGGWKIFEMDLASGGVRQVSRHSESTYLCGWAPDGVTTVGTVVRDMSPSDTDRRVAFFAPDGTESYPLKGVNAEFAAVSPDGRYIAFSRRGVDIYRKCREGRRPDDAEIWLYDTADGAFLKPWTDSDSAFHPVWRPDGKAFYYLGRAHGSPVTGVREHLLSGVDREVVSFGDDSAFQPSVSADGRTMVVRAGFDFWRLDPTAEHPVPERIVVRADGFQSRGTGTRRRFYDKAWNNDYGGDMSFCSDGMEVAFTAGGGLYVMDTVVKSPRLVAEAPRARVVEGVFTSDGSRIYCAVDRGDATEICEVRRADESLPWWENTSFLRRTVFASDTVLRGISVSPDASLLAWSDPLGNFVFSDTNGVEKARGPKAAGAGGYSWSPDSRYVAASLLDACNNYDVWIISADGSLEPYNLSRSWKWDGMPEWSPDGKIVVWSAERQGSDGNEIVYVYLDPADETADLAENVARSRRGISSAQKGEGGDKAQEGERPADGRVSIVFDGIAERIRRTGCAGVSPFFSHDSRTLAYDTGSGTDTIHIPDRLKGKRLTGRRGRNAVWYKKDDRIAWAVDDRPAHLDTTFDFKVYREDDLADYRELVFRTAWARIRDKFYDRGCHGADWNAVRDRYLPAARNASSYSVFARVMNLMLGELDASHLKFYPSSSSEREWVRAPLVHNWKKVTGHLGVKFEPGTSRVEEVIPGSPAEGLLSVGDVVAAIDGVKLGDGVRLDELMNAQEGRCVQVTVAGRESDPVYVKTSSYGAIRDLMRTAQTMAARRGVHEATGGRVGYLAVRDMNLQSYRRFEEEVFSEGWDKDALVIDLRGNLGGFTADRLLAVLCGSDHSRSVTPNGMVGYLFVYWTRPVFSKPVVLVVDERVQSNGEIFTHAVKTMKRGVVVGRRTSGSVIATIDAPLLDFGMFRDAFWGWFLPDGADMENNGVVPDVEVDITPADEAAGRDTQLDAAVKAALEAVSAPAPAFSPRYAR